MTKAKKQTAKERQLELVQHLLNVGWEVNHEWLGNFKNDEVDFEKLIVGKAGTDCHLVSPCEKYTVRVKKLYAAFWQKDPKWIKMGNYHIKDIEKTENGVKIGILHFIIDK